MPVYNAMPFLEAAVKSIIVQDFDSIEFILIDDGSTDKSYEYLRSVSDKRIRLYQNEVNSGMTYTLNKGIALSNGGYITRLDADDVATDNRFLKQYEYLNHNKEVVLLGGNAIFIDQNGGITKESPYATMSNLDLKWRLFFVNPFIHSSVTFNKKILLNNNLKYKDYSGADDYRLWSDLFELGKFHVVEDVFCYYRIHSNNMTSVKQYAMQQAHLKIANNLMGKYLGPITLEETQRLINIYKHRTHLNPTNFRLADIEKFSLLLRRFTQTQGAEGLNGRQYRKIFSAANGLSFGAKTRVYFKNLDLLIKALPSRLK
jgi:glycosyltransferase involved in cell wall biosynthesis